jgi:tetratricopeptide (TPR) repeat protein
LASIGALRLGHLQRARKLAERSVEVAHRIDDTPVIWLGTQTLAEALTAQGDPQTALAALVGLLDNQGDRLADPQRGMLHSSIARTWVAIGDGAQADFHARKALQLWPPNAPRSEPLYALGEAARLMGDLEGAHNYLVQAAAELSFSDLELEPRVLEALATVRRAGGNPQTATN